MLYARRMSSLSLQETWSPQGGCFGCGPANAKGLHVRSFPTGAEPLSDVVATWTPSEHHQAFPTIVNGGILGTLLDCHSNWTAAWHLMQRDGLEKPPVTVTADFHVKLRRPTPLDRQLEVRARVVESDDSRVRVSAEILSQGELTASCTGTFIAVPEDHPAHGSW